LTVNHGFYYIDTTVPLATQQQPGIVGHNVFQPSQTYYTFLLFAKPATQQTYQLYVGPGFNLDSDVWMSQASVGSVPFKFQQGNWPSTWMKSYDPSTGVLTVTMDMSFPDFKRLSEKGHVIWTLRQEGLGFVRRRSIRRHMPRYNQASLVSGHCS